jgi:hypothetical protein
MSELKPKSGNMKDNRLRNEDRRQNNVMPSFPFKDSSGATIRGCRRKIPERRINNIQAERIDEIVIS